MPPVRVLVMLVFVIVFLVGMYPTDSPWLITFGILGFLLTLNAPSRRT